MNSISISRSLRRLERLQRLHSTTLSQQYRCFSCSIRNQHETTKPPTSSSQSANYTHFGFETVAENLKQGKVAEVFSSVASSYDTMNDLMSLGIHRLWKDHFVRSLDPGINPILFSAPTSSPSTSSPAASSPSTPQGLNILDIAGGTGDVAFRMLDYASRIHNDSTTRVTVADINPEMLAAGRKRAASSPYSRANRLSFVEANAETLTTVPSSSVDLYTVAFGIRNFTNIPKALDEAYRVLKPGGVFACLEFSKVNNEAFNWAYKRWSFSAIPIIGQLVAGDRDSYQYLVESIERFPDQATFARMIQNAGFELPAKVGELGGGYEDLSGGIACIHKGVKPLEDTK
ncbi:UbiE/COQ5 methyltransferase [Microthyrium microscopicum]|uniref:2-methoxy-6-polyprenyl-1,4-benzoquinol methylase, mitochondrial n=1 Tax=Microthyrium microscopicum TaxID=703497 RepID=A0A6A6UG03_9PEZI|nr:UbiE/COQ5 methyltransferase [Microthyrium microscopicum]